MRNRAIPLRRMARVTAIFAAVPVAVIVVLAFLGHLGAGTALIAVLIAVIGVAAVAWRYMIDLETVVGYVEALAHENEARAPLLLRSGAMTDLAVAIGQIGRSWHRRNNELRELAASTEAIVENLPQPLILLDGHRRVVRATKSARDLLGVSVTGRDLAALLRNPMVLEAADRVIEGSSREDVEFSVQFPVERDFSAWIGRLPTPAADGTIAIVALYDITDIKRADQMRVDFVANASHELRTPLSVLLGCVKTLRGAAKDDPAARDRFLSMMETQSERMSRLVEDLMSLSRIELNEHTPPTGSVDLERTMERIAESLAFPASARNMKIVVDSEADLPAVAGDAEELTQLFQNLIDNALKYGREDSTVTVKISRADRDAPATMRAENGVVLVAVADEGEGISREHLPRLTERFYRVDTGRSREMGGTGLGLAIVKHIVSRHGGQLRIESQMGRGSTFSVYLPAAPSQRDIKPERVEALSPSDTAPAEPDAAISDPPAED